MLNARWSMALVVGALAVTVLSVTLVRPGAAASAPAGGTVTVTGQSTLSAVPTEAQITVGVQLVEDTAGAATQADSERVNAIVAALEKAGVRAADLQTENYNLSPNENNPSGNQAPRITNYTISDQIQVTTTDLAAVGALIDAAVKAGANEVQGVTFTVKDPNALVEQANDSALAQAHAQAANLAAAAGETLGTLVSLNVNQNSPTFPMYGVVAAAAAHTAILPPQSLTISATVTAVYRLVG
jgi:uncharacterized protein YggE